MNIPAAIIIAVLSHFGTKGPEATTPPWPSAGLPPFPGDSWTVWDPAPADVMNRCNTLFTSLQPGTWQTEQTNGRWVTYYRTDTAVVPYRLSSAQPETPAPAAPPAARPTGYKPQYEQPKAPAPKAPAAAPAAPAAPKASPAPPGYVQTHPGVYQPKPGTAAAEPKKVGPGSFEMPETVITAKQPTIKRGATGYNVKLVQRKLGLKDDGKFGPATESAVKAFQASHNLKTDGIVGPQTWSALGY